MSEEQLKPRANRTKKVLVLLVVVGLVLSAAGSLLFSFFDDSDAKTILPGPNYYHEEPQNTI